jgi:hypothetical protein
MTEERREKDIVGESRSRRWKVKESEQTMDIYEGMGDCEDGMW